MNQKIVKIGGASGFWGDSALGAPQLVAAGIDYLVFDYLAELTMSILINAKTKDAAFGYATDFVDVAMKSVLKDLAAKGIKVVSNAGGVNPRACAAALQKLCDAAGVKLKIAVVEGDDVLERIPALRARGVTEMFSGAPLPEKILSANAYLGAIPIAAALKRGADVVITGRCVDSAVTLGPLIHEFDWAFDTASPVDLDKLAQGDLDKLAQGALAGHIIECGAQATGGLFTDWESVPDWANIGYPIVECHADGSFVVTKPANTGGLVNTAVVAEQMLYEIGDPAAYILPDVVCDFTQVTMAQDVSSPSGTDADAHRVLVRGARGKPPTDRYKVSATYMEGWRAQANLLITGIDAARKAQRSGEAILERTRTIFKRQQFADYLETRLDIIGAETQYGPHARTGATREAVMRLAVRHDNPKALGVFAREVAPAGTSWSPGTTGMGGGRSKPAPNVRMFSFLLPKSEVRPRVELDGEGTHPPVPAGAALSSAGVEGSHLGEPHAPMVSDDVPPQPAPGAAPGVMPGADSGVVTVPLIRIAHARSGDKGNISNIGVVARKPEYLPLLRAQLTPQAVKDYFAHLVQGEVARYDLPGIDAFNCVLHEALDGGGMASLRADPLGKGMAQMLLDFPLQVPVTLVRELAATP